MRIRFPTSSPRDLAGPFFDEQAGNDQSPFVWGSVSVCVSLMSHVLVLELYSLICSLVTSSRIGKAGVRMLYITAAILYQYWSWDSWKVFSVFSQFSIGTDGALWQGWVLGIAYEEVCFPQNPTDGQFWCVMIAKIWKQQQFSSSAFLWSRYIIENKNDIRIEQADTCPEVAQWRVLRRLPPFQWRGSHKVATAIVWVAVSSSIGSIHSSGIKFYWLNPLFQ